VAVGAAGFAVLFRHTIGWVFVYGYRAPDVLTAFARLPWYTRVVVPMIGAGLAGFAGAIGAKLKGGHGVGEVMEAVALGKGRISLRLTLLKAFGSWLAIVSGGFTHVTDRLAGSIASNVLAAAKGVAIVRVHDVAAHKDALKVADAISAGKPPA